MNKIEAGTMVTCPICEKRLLKIVKTIFSGDRPREDHFKSFMEDPIVGAKMVSQCCDAEWFRMSDGKIHTIDGWRPNKKKRASNRTIVIQFVNGLTVVGLARKHGRTVKQIEDILRIEGKKK